MAYLDEHGIRTDDVQCAADDDTPEPLTPSEIVGAFMAGESSFYETFNATDRELANDYIDLLALIRNYKRDPNLTDDENIREKMAQINEFLDETLLEYVAG